MIADTGDRYPVLDHVQRETAKLCAIIRVRDDLAAIFPGCKFLLPTRTDEGSVVGIRFNGRTALIEDKNYCEAYHKLFENTISEFI